MLVGYLVQVADWLSERLLTGFGHDSLATLANTASWFNTFGHGGGSVMPLFVGALVALLAVIAGVLVTLELLLRANAIYLVTALVPLVYAMRIWPALQPAARRTLEVLVAIILAQPLVALAIAIGAGAGANLGGPGQRDAAQFGHALGGTVMLLLAALAPWAIVHLLPAPGTTDRELLDLLTHLLGKQQTLDHSTTHSPDGTRTTTHTTRHHDLAPTHTLVQQPPGHALVLLSHYPPVRVRVRPQVE